MTPAEPHRGFSYWASRLGLSLASVVLIFALLECAERGEFPSDFAFWIGWSGRYYDTAADDMASYWYFEPRFSVKCCHTCLVSIFEGRVRFEDYQCPRWYEYFATS